MFSVFAPKSKLKMNRGLQQWKWLHIVICVVLSVLRTGNALVDTTYVTRGVPKGAVCLDGSPPAYNLDKGFGSGINNWLVHFEGGGWCNNVTSCLTRSTGFYGSSKAMPKLIKFGGMLSNDSQFNPDFYNWNRVKVRYCDGASFSGDVEAVDPDTKLHYRGARIFVAVVEDLLERGLKNAENALLTGCSAGGLAILLHCDSFKSFLPKSTKVKCFADAGFFINAKDISGSHDIEGFFDEVVNLHGIAKNLPESCTSRMKPNKCFFPENYAREIQTPFFILNSAIDSWQIPRILVPDVTDPRGLWTKCKANITACSASQIKTIKGYRKEFIKVFKGLGDSKSRGYFIHSCFFHCHTEHPELWFGNGSLTLKNTAPATAVGDWFYNRRRFQKTDCPYPCNKSCPTYLSPIINQ